MMAEALRRAQAEQERESLRSGYTDFQRTYRDRPSAFAAECLDWQAGKGPAPYQYEIMEALPAKRRVAVRGPHGLGKTALASWIILWFALTRDGSDWKIITTASAWRQVEKYLWPEVHKWTRHIRWGKVGREPFSQNELLTLQLKLKTGAAFAVVSDNPALIEGAHADNILYVFDESKTIPAGVFDAAEGALTGASGTEAYALTISTPGEPNGRFYDIQKRRPGLEDWWVRHVTRSECIAAGQMQAEWADNRKRQWGETSAVYQNRVEGEFASADEDGVIPLSWVEHANERWQVLKDLNEWERFTAVGVDVARSGSDKTYQALRYGPAIKELRETAKEDTMQTTGRVAGVLRANGGLACVDVIGIGAGVVDRLREMKFRVLPFNASERTGHLDVSGELGFINKRAAAWWNLREILDPANRGDVALPPDDMLTGDLTSLHWKVASGGRIQVEEKEKIKERLGRSPDAGDAVVQAYWVGVDDGPPEMLESPW